MAVQRHDNFHSRLVAWLKILLPLAALAILSTLFLVSRTIDPSDAIPYAEVDVEDRVREPRMTAPSYAGVTSDGASLTVTAAEARPDAGSGGAAQTIRAELATPDGALTTLSAGTGRLDAEARRLSMENGVEITTTSGYRVTTEGLTSALDRTDVASAGAVTATGPLGEITAGGMAITTDPATRDAYVLVFKDRVKLIYRPAQ